MFRCAALVFLLALAAHQGAAIKCYQCTSKTNEMCKDPMPMMDNRTTGALMPTDCFPRLAWTPKNLNDLIPGSVSKMLDSLGSSIGNIGSVANTEMVCLKLNVRAGEETVIMRQCALSTPSSDTSAPKGSGVCELAKKAAEGKDEFCGVCDMDGCNSAPRHVTVTSLLVMAPLLALLFKP
ncbi:hypothetical protein B566_EDAN004895 [Ephemera danica]|nr:hypothetical protein B566_EDAN004895 [Ephemera danica]